MKTPIVDFVRRYAQSGGARFHMPGHKGKTLLGVESMDMGRLFLPPEVLDITEVSGADVLYDAKSIIAESEGNAAALFGTAHTFYSTEGSTLAIKAMLALVQGALPRGTRPHILAGRNAHKAFLFGAALLDVAVTWLYPTAATHLCACPITAKDVEDALEAAEVLPHAVYLTSPDYLGNTLDIAGIAAACDRYGVPLLVDNAHGAYLNFLSPSRHPIAQGATMCADSAHKTLPVLTGGAYLHIGKKAPAQYVENARAALSLFASTSPSYLIMQSLDLCNAYLDADYAARLAETAARIEDVRGRMRALGFTVEACEPLKIVIEARPSGYTGEALAAHLRQNGIEPEFADRDFLVLMCTPENEQADFERLIAALGCLPQRTPLSLDTLPQQRPISVLSVREAMLSPTEWVPLAAAEGRICAAPTVSCPPAVPVAVAGERLDAATVACLHYYGVDTVAVIKE